MSELVDFGKIQDEIKILAVVCKQLDRITTERGRKAALGYLWDRYVEHPIPLPEDKP